MAVSIGVDIGGTFTDCVVVAEGGEVTTGKAPSTPRNFALGFFDAVENAAGNLGLTLEQLLESSHTLVHATTAGSNAVVERKGSRVGLVTTAGHGDAILIMRGGGRTKGLDIDDLLYIAGTYKPEPIVPKSLIVEIPERVDVKGREVVALDEDAVRRGARQLLDAGVETIAISFLWSFANPAHEQRAREIVHELAPDTFVSCSYEIAPRMGEYYRTVATVMNCYLGPMMADYTGRIADRAAELGYRRPVLFAQCIGGAVPVEEVRRRPLFTLDSGPVSGIVASAFLGGTFGYPNVITADMGGTTFDVSVISDGTPTRRESTVVNQYEMYLPMLDVESIGAGGGSIAWLDPGSGTMKVGPRSAGADPGPLCYRRGGTEPTVTDADVALGIVNPEGFLGGRQQLDRQASIDGIAELGERVGLSMEETAAGILEIVDNTMAEKIRRMTVFRGHDPREFVLFAFGGAGPTHASAFARELGVESVVVPLGDIAAVLSAMGTVSSDIVHVHDRSVRLIAPFAIDELSAIFGELDQAARSQLEDEGFSREQIEIKRHVAMKYGAQVYDLETALEPDDTGESIVARFEANYAARYGKDSGYAPAGIEIIRERVYASGILPRPRLVAARALHGANGSKPTIGSRSVWWRDAGGWTDTPIYRDIAAGGAGYRVEGPAVIELPDTTVPVRPQESLEVDEWGNLLLTF